MNKDIPNKINIRDSLIPSITVISKQKAELNFSYLGFNSKLYRINIRKNLKFNIVLKSAITLQEIVITESRSQLQEGLSVEDAPNFTSGTLNKMPSLVGEPDIIRYFQTLPGVQSGSGGFGGMHVRGGESDQNSGTYNKESNLPSNSKKYPYSFF